MIELMFIIYIVVLYSLRVGLITPWNLIRMWGNSLTFVCQKLVVYGNIYEWYRIAIQFKILLKSDAYYICRGKN